MFSYLKQHKKNAALWNVFSNILVNPFVEAKV